MPDAHGTHDTSDVESATAPPPIPPPLIPEPPPAEQIEEFFRRYWAGLVRSLMREGADRWEAQDAVAEAIREALRRWPELTHPVAWVRTAARSHWLKQRRSAGRGDLEVLVADLGELGTGRADPELVAYELQEWFAGVLAQLPPARREALELSAEGLTPTEIARQVGKTPEAVRTALKLGRKQAVAMWQAVPSQRGRTPEPATEPQPAGPRSTEDPPAEGSPAGGRAAEGPPAGGRAVDGPPADGRAADGLPTARPPTAGPPTAGPSAAGPSADGRAAADPSAAAGTGGSQRDSGAGNGPRPESEGGRS